jgi:hypothetical protein
MKRIFQIGFNKCGTSTLLRFFQKNNIPSVHWEGGELAKRFDERKSRNHDPFFDYPNATFFSDMIYLSHDRLIEPYRDFKYIHYHHPDSFFILNTRNVGRWLKSRLSHGNFAQRYQSVFNLESVDEVISRWLVDWHQHHYEVLKYFEAHPKQLLYFDIELDGADKLVSFLNDDFKLDPTHYGHFNISQAYKVRWQV